MHIRDHPGVLIAVFDQCMMGLVSKVEKKTMKKRTRVMTNSLLLFNELHGKDCDGQHDHQVIQGNEGGQKRSQSAQVYPPPMVHAICKALRAEEQQKS